MFSQYDFASGFDEMFDEQGEIRKHYQKIYDQLLEMGQSELVEIKTSMQDYMMKQGVTFTLYSGEQGNSLERTIPVDIIPRVIPTDEWTLIEKGVKQRVMAINQFIRDVYHEQVILREGIIPRKMVVSNPYFLTEMMGVKVPGDVYIPLAGIDLIRDDKGQYFVLEDNLRTPSGLSYIYKNRTWMKRLFQDLMTNHNVRPIDKSLDSLLTILRSLSPTNKKDPIVVLLTPGCYNSAYFEHTFIAQQLGIPLVEGKDLKVINQKVYMKTIKGLQQVDVVYRRVDDEFLDPLCFRADSVLGVPGIMNAYRAGNVAIANAPGTGIADDKAMYTYVPDMIRFYLNEEPILNNIPTYVLAREKDLQYVLAHLPEMVVKETALSGGYGMLIGPCSTEQEITEFRQKIIKDPAKYIAQPTINLSSVPSLVRDGVQGRHVDLRPFAFMGVNEIEVLPGGLTRVALKEGSLVVNSSQGGGSKDTWVLNY
ncbi:circularly permuted type 2 ATP-grasp protein [Bacillus sp. DNRA2]|uniref:circularly permuted type 2 ATP-grasp protein n=1 Tax=Bacillus sp. DNRA2 TaxID=2723053 RepID=UPI00145CA6E7|nr:circularly permuted type 2 ATP-grasp protein [Bacillus sp. DNRA2]NMD70871.1 circularly permuted type 2 ATP-grasp protein [Bacillus sp. DNRA2]